MQQTANESVPHSRRHSQNDNCNSKQQQQQHANNRHDNNTIVSQMPTAAYALQRGSLKLERIESEKQKQKYLYTSKECGTVENIYACAEKGRTTAGKNENRATSRAIKSNKCFNA
ncbi:unnamed protein product [Ceratitis capitata]|uniref:(Mediterranean fruit fly) hypothetical protein n=1 Tax=Ceratitis capitata TaxID=7213 RepID=A0A811VE58_CERCA|nr:unnamed protein product [Ceratitis capitata]